MKRFTSILLALAMILTLLPVGVFAADNISFSDVKGNEYFSSAASALEELGILAGYPDGTFGAEKSITRAEMAAVVCRIIDKEDEAEKSEGKTDFDDVEANHWASGYINIASKEGIINGDGNGKFRPEDDVKYEEAIKMVVCALGYGDDVKVDPKDWSASYLKVADEKGITGNLKGTKGKAATRGDIAVMSYNGLKSDLDTPTASLASGSYTGTKSVTLTTATKDADIYYTTDGTTPTVKSTKYTKAVSVSKTTTLKAIAVKDGVLVSDVMSVDYTIKASSGGGGSGSSSSTTKYTVSFDLNYEGATGAPASQSVKKGEKVIEPTAPQRNGYTFVGWYEDNTYSKLFDFSDSITKSFTLFARWNDIIDEDSDGIPNEIEAALGLSDNSSDTDGDGLTDYQEITIVGTDPLKYDTDGDGLSDSEDDEDGDGITNTQEIQLLSSPVAADTDLDGLKDNEELEIRTSLVNVDTDDDGLTDKDEVVLGTNPLVAKTDGVTLDSERVFVQEVQTDNITEDLLSSDNDAVPSLSFEGSGNINGDTLIFEATSYELNDNKAIRGIPIEITTSVNMNTGSVLSFSLSDVLNEDIATDTVLLICKLTEDGEIVPLETTYNSTEKTLEATVFEPGVYFVLDAHSFLQNLGIDPMSYFHEVKLESLSLFSSSESSSELLTTNPEEVQRSKSNDRNDHATSSKPHIEYSNLQEVGNQIQLMATDEIKGQADIVFVIDATGSMQDEINNVAYNINAFAQKLITTYNINANLGIVEYQDISHDGMDSTLIHKNGSSNWFNATSISSFKNKINSIYAKDGGDTPETPIDALELAHKMVAASHSQKFFILLTDAGYKVDNRYEINSMAEMIDMLKADRINVSVITDSYEKSTYNPLYTQTGGIYADIYSNFAVALEAIADMIGTETNDGYWITLEGSYTPIRLDAEPEEDSDVDTDGDGLKDIDELLTRTGKVVSLKSFIEPYIREKGKTWDEYVSAGGQTTTSVWLYRSNPADADTDGDGYKDKEDSNPRKWDVSDRDLAIAAGISYSNPSVGTEVDKSSIKLNNGAKVEEMEGWTVIDTWAGGAGFYALALKKGKNIVIAYRGSKGLDSYEGIIDIDWIDDWVFADVINVLTGISTQVPAAKAFAQKVVSRYPDYNIYICGHSLGGNLALNASAKALDLNQAIVKRVSTYNGLGIPVAKLLTEVFTWDITTLSSYADRFFDYEIEGDPVSAFEFKPDHKWYDMFDVAITAGNGYRIIMPLKISGDAHSLGNFYQQLEPFGRPIN